jgi:hypothetical protein
LAPTWPSRALRSCGSAECFVVVLRFESVLVLVVGEDIPQGLARFGRTLNVVLANLDDFKVVIVPSEIPLVIIFFIVVQRRRKIIRQIVAELAVGDQ